MRLLRAVVGRLAGPGGFLGGVATATLLAIGLASGSGEAAAQTASRTPNGVARHLATGFPLTGSHESARCEDCHVNGILKGTPKACDVCHGTGSRINAVTMSTSHPPVVQPCSVCHSTVTFTGTVFDHSGVLPGSCASCHNGKRAKGKPLAHIVTSESCDSCHRTATWAGATFDHSRVLAGTCATCHNGAIATGKPAGHMVTSASCDSCHRTTGWLPATFNHAGVTPGTCAGCHNGKGVQGAPATHIPTTASCDACHTTVKFAGTAMNHAPVAGMACATCHEVGKVWFGVTIVTRPTPAQNPNHPVTGECAGCHTSTTTFALGTAKPANHLPTSQACTACHASTATFKAGVMNHSAITSGCATCHAASATGIAFAGVTPMAQGAGHIPTTADCATCHNSTTSFAGTTMNHAGITHGCASCHDAGKAFAGVSGLKTMPANHIPTRADCAACHKSTKKFAGAAMNHAGITAGCANCHGGQYPGVKTKPQGHPTTTAPCETCHNRGITFKAGGAVAPVMPGAQSPGAGQVNPANGITAASGAAAGAPEAATASIAAVPNLAPRSQIAAAPAPLRPAMNLPGPGGALARHAGVTPGSCANCHNGATAPGKPARHLMTPASCDSCHRTTAWIPATFAHTGIAPNTCASCHNGASAKGKPSGHFVSPRSCDSCHRTTAWSPPTAYRHVSPAFKQHAGGVRCVSCHATNNEVVVWKSAAFKPDCAGCHANSFKPAAHVKVATPRVLYTAAELRDCSGSCHEYANSSATTVTKPKTGHHRPTNGGY